MTVLEGGVSPSVTGWRGRLLKRFQGKGPLKGLAVAVAWPAIDAAGKASPRVVKGKKGWKYRVVHPECAIPGEPKEVACLSGPFALGRPEKIPGRRHPFFDDEEIDHWDELYCGARSGAIRAEDAPKGEGAGAERGRVAEPEEEGLVFYDEDSGVSVESFRATGDVVDLAYDGLSPGLGIVGLPFYKMEEAKRALRAPPRNLARRQSLGGDTRGAAVQAPQGRRGSVTGTFEPKAHDLFMEALRQRNWDEVELHLLGDAITEPRTFIQALTIALAQYENTLRERGLPLDGLRYGRVFTGEADTPERRAQTRQWARVLSFLLKGAACRRVDLTSFRYREQRSRDDACRSSFPTIMAYLVARSSSRRAPALLSIKSLEQHAAFESARAALIVRLKEIQDALKSEPHHKWALLWVKCDLETVRSGSLAEMRLLIESKCSCRPIDQREQANDDRLKAAFFSEPAGKEFCRLVFQRIALEEGLRVQFFEMCCLKMSAKKRGYALEAVSVLKSFGDFHFMKALKIAAKSGQWEWVRDILATGTIPFMQSIGIRFRLFFHDLWQFLVSLFG